MERLPAELLALMSAIELRSTDWWERASQQVVLSALALAGGPTQRADVMHAIQSDFGLAPTDAEVNDAIAALERRGSVIETPSGHLKVTEEALASVQRSTRLLEDAETAAEAIFAEQLLRAAPELDAGNAWRDFNKVLLVPLVQDLGVRAYAFIEGTPFELEATTLLDAFLGLYDAKYQDSLRHTVLVFLDPNNEPVRTFVLAKLTAYFFLEAIKISSPALAQLTKIASTRADFTLFLDTNLLFSVLDVHDNPANESAVALMQLSQSLATSAVNLKFYVTPETLAEAKNALANARNHARGITLTRNLANGVSNITFSGLTQRFIDQARREDGIRNPETYFDFYIVNLLALANDKGVQLYNEDLSPYHVMQAVIDDVHNTMEFRNRRRVTRGLEAKPYAQYQHDVVLWHFARKKRAYHVEAPLAAKYWVVTVDYGLLGFDAYKTRRVGHMIPICVHPTVLIQMLQFWVPRSGVLDTALMSTLRLPFMFLPFDSELEATTVKLLRTLSRFENIHGLSADTVEALIVNDYLRAQLDGADEEGAIALVRDAFVEIETQLKTELEQATARAADLKLASDQSTEAASDLAVRVRELSSDMEVLQGQLEDARRAHDELEVRTAEEAGRHARRRFISTRVIPITFASCAATVLIWLAIRQYRPGVEVSAAIITFSAVGSLACWLVELSARGAGNAACAPIATMAVRMKRWLFVGLLGAAVISVGANVATEELRIAPDDVSETAPPISTNPPS